VVGKVSGEVIQVTGMPCVFQELAQALLQSAQTLCPRVTHRSSVCEQLADCVAKKSRQTALFIQDTFMQHIGELLSNKLR
jgi:hypothetical protein